MARERPPPGYKRMDKPLYHDFNYLIGLNGVSPLKADFTATILKTTKDSVAPDTIEVNDLNTGYAVAGGPVICFDSVIAKVMIDTDFTLTNLAKGVDEVPAIRIQHYPIFGSFPEWLDVADNETGTTIKAILGLTKDATLEDITPTFNGTDLSGAVGTHPLSTVTTPDAEVFGDWNLTTDTAPEAVGSAVETLFDALSYYSNGKLLSSHIGSVKSIVLTDRRPHAKLHLERFVPSAVKRGLPYGYFGWHYNMEVDGDQLVASTELTAGQHVRIHTKIRFAEWNQHFNQQRM